MLMDLFQRFALGEIDAFETLVRRFQGDIYAWIVRIVRDPGIAEDLTVETLWRAYRARKQFRLDGNFAAWSRRIATNLALDHLRRPDRLFTVFAGQDADATARARSYFTGYPPSSPQIALFKDGALVFMLERKNIEGRAARDIAADLTAAFDQYCG